MGYARLVEGRVEKLDIAEELDQAILRVFPPAVKYEVKVHRIIPPPCRRCLMQRMHLSEAFVNLCRMPGRP